MAQPISRFLLIACCVFVQLPPPAIAKEPKVKEKDVAGLTYAIFPNGSTPSKESVAIVAQQFHWDNGGAGNLDRLAYHLRFEKVDETSTPDGNSPRYRILAEGAPENKVYELSTWELGKLIHNGDQDIFVNSQGLVMTRRPRPEEEALSRLPGVELYVSPKTITGEPMRYAVASRDGEVTAFGTLVPFPVVSQDGGCRLEARVAAQGSAAVLIVADGFASRMRLPFVLESQGEISNVEATTDDNGHAVVAGFPFIQGKTQGVLKATAEGHDCLPSVQIPWNSGSPSAPAAPAGKQP